MITTSEQLEIYLVASCGNNVNPICAIDTEADSLHRYKDSLCLIQFADPENSVLIDPLVVEDLSPLTRYLAKATVWMHGADYDMSMLKRELGSLPMVVFDTQIGARLLGARRYGLADLVKQYFDVELCKTSQKADWGKRPLSPKMIEYALNDVYYLLEMGEKIVTLLREKDRYHWFEESCLAAKQRVANRDETSQDAWRIQGSGKLSRCGLAYLSALWNWRDEEAKAWNRPSFMVLPNRLLLEFCFELEVKKRPALPLYFRADRIKRYQAAIAQVLAMPPDEWPERVAPKRRNKDPEFYNRVDAFIATREKEAQRLDIDGSLIASRAVLESIAAGEEDAATCLLGWQRECLSIH